MNKVDSNKNAIKQAREIISHLLKIIAEERIAAVKIDGQELQKLNLAKMQMMKQLSGILTSVGVIPGHLKRSLSMLKYMNNQNLELFKSILKTTIRCKREMKDCPVESAAYDKSGRFSRLPVSMKLSESA